MLNCHVSDRYIKFGVASETGTREGACVQAYIMTDRSWDDKADRRLCEIILSLEELKQMVAKLESDL